MRALRDAMRRLSRFGRATSGHAAAEFVVLLPLYLAMIAGLHYLADISILKQQCVEAARYYAFGGTRGDDVFFRGFQGSGSASGHEQRFAITEQDVQKELRARGVRDRVDARVVASLLENGGSPWLAYRVGSASYRYRPSFYAFAGVAPETTIGAEVTVLARTTNQREAYREGSHRHPIEAITDEVGRPWHPGDDPFQKRDWDTDDRGRRSPWDVDWFKDKHPRE